MPRLPATRARPGRGIRSPPRAGRPGGVGAHRRGAHGVARQPRPRRGGGRGGVDEALREWRVRGVPPNPGAWLTQAARHNALDRLRRETRYRDKLALLADPDERHRHRLGRADERLPLLFGCCHPALSPDAQLALTLRAICGLTTAQIARATLTPESTVAQRIVRAKRKIGAAGIPLRIPEGAERAERLDIVLTVVSVMYSEAHLVAGGDASADRDLADDALWLARVIARRAAARGRGAGAARAAAASTAPARTRGPSTATSCCSPSRTGRGGIAALLAEARRCSSARRCCGGRAAGSCTPRSPPATPMRRPADDTDWLQVLTLYDMLLAYDRSPVVRLNRAVALGRGRRTRAPRSPRSTRCEGALAGYHLWHAVRAQHAARARARRRGARRRPARARADRERGRAPPARVARRLSRARAGRRPARGQASTGESACETSRSRVVIPSRDRIDSRCPCTDANPGPRSA